MELLLQSLATLTVLVSGVFGIQIPEQDAYSNSAVPSSVELGLREVSPNGPEGGYAIPASGCSTPHPEGYYHDCEDQKPDISVNRPLVRMGEPVTVSWDPKLNINCVLSTSVTRLTTTPNPTTAPNPNAVGSRISVPTGEVTFAISCAGTGNLDVVTAKVLPRIQET